ncbi:MAG: hypothetical protein WC829_14985 [Hyphomicrobium sp.]|jgi:hypothetical protein
MSSVATIRSLGYLVLVLAGLGIVHAACPAAALERRAANELSPSTGTKSPKPAADPGPLPIPAEEMRQAILAATHSGDIEDLREPLEWNEIKPEVSAPSGEDPITFWKRTSGDGNGREILAALANILALRPARLPLGPDLENNIIYVWPYLAELELDKLSPAQEVELLRLVGPAEAKAMRAKKKWTWWRLSIGADGTWHSLKKSD